MPFLNKKILSQAKNNLKNLTVFFIKKHPFINFLEKYD